MIKNKYTGGEVEFSCEVFPPKRNDEMYDIFQTLDDISTIKPDYISVTYGAGGSNSKKTAKIAAYIQHICEVESLAHMTAVGMNKDSLKELLDELNEKGVKRILALRGDRPRTMTEEEFANRYYKYASDIIPEIKQYGSFQIYAACYPEKHPESPDLESDIKHLKAKVELGVDELITQMFFDNEKLYRFMDMLDKNGINANVHAGIMPITRVNQLGTSVSLSGSSVPTSLSNLIARHSDDPEGMKKAGIEFAVNQIEDLLKHGVGGIHLYSMNKADITKEIYEAII
ncbi:MAG: methylenetetrahydrofolate reductase [NAD(P)H] [Lachnospiraceae bacterium]|jgi:methylenetetrahydrofolate reductase (NADPH)|nr:methylenetetrahydrofolate reductase [NAD(P)H] [Lachnospiraceae bacterium]